MTRSEIDRQIEQCEREGKFDVHVDPIPREMIIPVDEHYHYVGHRTFLENIRYGLEKAFIVCPFTWYENTFVLKTRYVGRENLRGLKGAVLTCNHVEKFDCLAVKYGARGHRTYVVAGDFNNMKGFLGEMMRAGDMVPLNTTLKGKYNFLRVIDEILRKGKFLLIYPEASMWRDYKKPRPYKTSAFRIAARHQLPVVPQFITFRDSDKKDSEGVVQQLFTVHICPPIYPRPEWSLAQNADYLCNEAFAACKRVYEETYGLPLTYTCEKEMPHDLDHSAVL